jgi:hypothetical protein
VLENLGPEEWNVTEAARDFSSNNIAHKFWSCKTALGMAEIFRALCVLQVNNRKILANNIFKPLTN